MTLPPLSPSTDNQIVNDPTTRASLLRRSLQQMLAFGGLIAIFIVFAIASPDVFPSYTNVIQILFSAVVIGLLALGSTLVIITAGIDLSVGTGMALCAVMSATFIVTWHIPVVLGVILAILFGGLIGMLNGFSVALLKLPPFIATLAMMMVASGLALVVSNKRPIYFDPGAYTNLSTGSLIPGSNFPNAIIVYAIAAAYFYGAIMNLWSWPTITGITIPGYTGPTGGLDYVPGAPWLDNVTRFGSYTLLTSTAGWDTGRAISTAIALAVLGRPILDVLHRAGRRARLS